MIQVASGTQVGFMRALGGSLELPSYLVFLCWAPLGRFWAPFWRPLQFEGDHESDIVLKRSV